MEIYQLRYFVAAAETGSFTKAAERVHVAQPTLSAGVKKLEQDLGVELFERRARRTFLTGAGLKFLDRARNVLAECNRARHELSLEHTAQNLRLGCVPTVPATHLAALLRDFAKAWPSVAVDVEEAEPARLEKWLDQERIDAAITLTLGDDDLSENLSGEVLYRERMVLAHAVDHPFAARQSLHIADLRTVGYIYRTHCPHTRAMTRDVARHGVHPHVSFRTSRDERALAMIAAGQGVSMVPDTFSWPGVALAPVAELEARSTIRLVWPKIRNHDIVSEFKSFATSHDWKPRPAEAIVESRLNWAR